MGQGLPKAVTSVAVKRVGGTAFRVGFAEMNGWRPSMEDAHVIYAQDTWGFFGVFDGHGGDQCSGFIARRINEELVKSGMPESDDAVTELAFRLDKEFLDSNQPSGSTGTFVIVQAPSTPGGDYHLRVGNIGDSRVLLGRADGSIFPGPGTDRGLTTDHKPDLPSERARIERTGGNVQEVMGVARVNGDLAVSRAFGDAQHKNTGGPSPKDHPVSCAPELQEFDCGPTDFLMLVCDGISEGSFPNEAVVKLAAEKLQIGEGQPVDPAQAAIAVCHEAIKCGSKDNLSCMIVLLGGGDVPGEPVEFIPGPFEAPENAAFRKAYASMAEHAGITLPQALEKRYCNCEKQLATSEDETEAAKELAAELSQYGPGPGKELEQGSAERVDWFQNWLERTSSESATGGMGEGGDSEGNAFSRDQLWEMLQNNPRLRDMAENSGLGLDRLLINDQEPMRTVRVAKLEELKPAVEAHSALKWDDRLADACGCEGIVLRDDESDGTAQVRFPPPLGFKAWLPTSMLQELTQPCKRVKACETQQLLEAVEAHSALKWDDRLAKLSGQEGFVVQHDKEDATLQVRFPSVSLTAWLPESTLTYLEDSQPTTEAPATPAESEDKDETV